MAHQLVAPYKGNPYRIGYFSDNEVGWWYGALFTYYLKQPAASHTKQKLLALLRETYTVTTGSASCGILCRRAAWLPLRRSSRAVAS